MSRRVSYLGPWGQYPLSVGSAPAVCSAGREQGKAGIRAAQEISMQGECIPLLVPISVMQEGSVPSVACCPVEV